MAAVYNFDREASIHEKAAIFGYLESLAGKAWRDVVAERVRQVVKEGFGPARDDTYTDRELALAGSAYALIAARPKSPNAPKLWPWDQSWWKPTGQRENLVKAAALILAEIERIDRAATIDALAEGGKPDPDARVDAHEEKRPCWCHCPECMHEFVPFYFPLPVTEIPTDYRCPMCRGNRVLMCRAPGNTHD